MTFLNQLVEFLLDRLEPILFSLLMIAAFALGRTDFVRRLFGAIPISHKIAVIGLPGAGKTSLITAMFELIQKGKAKPLIKIHGEKTIALINRNIARLASGLVVGPTKENDTYVFRFSYSKARLVQTLTYDVEIADFPGEYTAQIEASSQVSFDSGFAGEALFQREFFSWIASAAEYLFVIDLSKVYSSGNALATLQDISARVRTSWQVIEDAVSDRGVGSLSRRQVHLVFTKIDSVLPQMSSALFVDNIFQSEEVLRNLSNDELAGLQHMREQIAREGMRTDLLLSDAIKLEEILLLRAAVMEHFQDLISFLEKRTRRLTVRFTSLRIRDYRGERLGVTEIVEGILP